MVVLGVSHWNSRINKGKTKTTTKMNEPMNNETRETNICICINEFASLQQKGWDVFGASQIDILKGLESMSDEQLSFFTNSLNRQATR